MATVMIETTQFAPPPKDLDIFGRPIAIADPPSPLHRHKAVHPVFDQGLLDDPPALVGFKCECGMIIER